MSGTQRDYRVDHFREHRHEAPSRLAEVGPAAGAGGAGHAAEPAPVAPASNQSMIDLLTAGQEGADPERDADEVRTLDPELLEQARGTLQTSWTDWAVTDDDARATLGVLQNADPEQQGLLVQALRDSGELDTLLAELPAEELEKLDGTLGAYLTSDRIADVMDDMFVTDAKAGGAMDLLVTLPADQQAAALLELDDAAFSTFLEELPPERRTELEGVFEVMADPDRRTQLWGAVHAGRAQATHDASMEEGPAWYDWSDEANAVRHRNDQRDAILSSTLSEVDEEVSHMRGEIEAGNAGITDVMAMEHRKQRELDLENGYGVNLTNDAGSDGWFYDVERRVWTEDELAAMEGAFSRMPEDHVRNNTALTEIRRTDVKRSGLFGEEDRGVGASAGGGQITFFDTGADFSNGTNGPGTPWRTEGESDLSGHDAAEHGSNGSTHLIQEVLSHELGHTVHQGDSELEADFHALSGWDRIGTGEVRDRLMASGMSREDADAEIERLEATRESGYNVRHQTRVDGQLVQIDPYSGSFLTVDEEAVAGRDEDPSGDWGYAETNPSDHFAELYTKAVHAPESLHRDLLERPQADVDRHQASVDALRATLDAQRDSLSPEDLTLMEADLATREETLRRAQHTADLRRSQHEFMRERVFGTDDSDIQALVAPPGKEAIYEAYQREAAMCMTPLQLDALRQRYAGQL